MSSQVYSVKIETFRDLKLESELKLNWLDCYCLQSSKIMAIHRHFQTL